MIEILKIRASMIITQSGEILMGQFYNGHSRIFKEHGIPEETRCKYARLNIEPPDGDVSVPLDRWSIRVVYAPDWYSEPWGEELVREALPRWERSHIFRSGVIFLTGRNINVILLGTVVANFVDLCESTLALGQSARAILYNPHDCNAQVSGNAFCSFEQHEVPPFYAERAKKFLENLTKGKVK
jgi:hypothetical protein